MGQVGKLGDCVRFQETKKCNTMLRRFQITVLFNGQPQILERGGGREKGT